MLGPLSLLVISPFVGSFAGVLIRRLPAGQPVVFARSACEACGRALTARELVPLASFVLQRGRCRSCRAPIAPFHPAIECLAGVVVLWAHLAEPDPARLWADCVLGWILLTLVWIDWEHLILPDMLTLPLLVLGLAATMILQPDAVVDHAAATAVGYVGVRGLALAYRLLRRREGIGQGDAKLVAAAGAWLGLAALPLAILGGAVFGILIALAAAARTGRLRAETAVPFGPGLGAAIWLVRLYGPA